jgi:glucosamine--fructose-6-phosphate aminotransferase (isomerizing)
MSDMKVLLGAGPEKAVASTKAYTAKLALIMLLTYTLANKFAGGKRLLLQIADEIERLLMPEQEDTFKKLAKKLVHTQHMYTIGRGISHAIALEAALKIKEVSYIHTEGLAGGELKHGPIALIEKGTPCIVFAPSDETYGAIISNATEIKARGGYIIGVASEKSQIFDEWIEVKDTGYGAMITYGIPMQLLSYYLALEKNLDPDKPRNLAKSVTVK